MTESAAILKERIEELSKRVAKLERACASLIESDMKQCGINKLQVEMNDLHREIMSRHEKRIKAVENA